MSVYEVGRVAVKTQGREAGLYCVVVDIVDRSYVLVDGVKVRRRRWNVKHLVPTPDKIELKKGAKNKAMSIGTRMCFFMAESLSLQIWFYKSFDPQGDALYIIGYGKCQRVLAVYIPVQSESNRFHKDMSMSCSGPRRPYLTSST